MWFVLIKVIIVEIIVFIFVASRFVLPHVCREEASLALFAGLFVSLCGVGGSP
jgi:hypothetical protein